MSTQRRTTVWADVDGRTASSLLTTAAGAAAVQGQIALISNAYPLADWEGDLVVPGGAAVAALYQSVADVAELLYATAAGAIVKVIVPAPVSTIFLADQETVDPAAVLALTGQVIADIVTVAGVPVAAYVAGTRQRRRV